MIIDEASQAIRGDVSQATKYLRERSSQLHDIRLKIEGMKSARESQGVDTGLYETILMMFSEFERMDALIADALMALNANNLTAEDKAMQAKENLAKLLGLMPDASNQEIIEAIDDVAPVIAGYRKRKRGT